MLWKTYELLLLSFFLGLSGASWDVSLDVSGIFKIVLGCPRCGSILSIYSRGTASESRLLLKIETPDPNATRSYFRVMTGL
jgi:hypothetical protein